MISELLSSPGSSAMLLGAGTWCCGLFVVCVGSAFGDCGGGVLPLVFSSGLGQLWSLCGFVLAPAVSPLGLVCCCDPMVLLLGVGLLPIIAVPFLPSSNSACLCCA